MRAVVIVGSRARADVSADRWSDLDALLFVDDPSELAREQSWVAEFGTPVLTFLEPTAIGERIERRVLYEGGEDVDFPLVDASTWRELLPTATIVLARGYRVLFDDLGIEDELAKLSPPGEPPLPSAAELTELASDFWYDGALGREEASHAARSSPPSTAVNGYMKALLVTLMSWHARVGRSGRGHVRDGGSFVERWADPGALAALERRMRGTTCVTSPARSGRRSTSSRGSTRRRHAGSAIDLALDHAESQAPRVARSSATRGTGLRSES